MLEAARTRNETECERCGAHVQHCAAADRVGNHRQQPQLSGHFKSKLVKQYKRVFVVLVEDQSEFKRAVRFDARSNGLAHTLPQQYRSHTSFNAEIQPQFALLSARFGRERKVKGEQQLEQSNEQTTRQ